jgi:hypothetical protein
MPANRSITDYTAIKSADTNAAIPLPGSENSPVQQIQ